jgi:hypothetical protein
LASRPSTGRHEADALPHVSRFKLYSVRDSSSVEGRFYLGSGWIGTTEYYAYYRDANPGMKKGRVPVENSVIFEGAATPELVVLEKKYDKDWYWYIGGQIGLTLMENQKPQRYQLYVPAGTIVQKFTLE